MQNEKNFKKTWENVLPKSEDLGHRDWGTETLLAVETGKIMMKKLFLKSGTKGGLQYHRKRVEAGYIISGKLKVRIGLKCKIEDKILNEQFNY